MVQHDRVGGSCFLEAALLSLAMKGAVQLVFSGHFSRCSCKFVVSVKGGEFKVFLLCYLQALGFLARNKKQGPLHRIH